MLGRDMNVPVLLQKDKLFPDMDSFYFLEPTQKEGVYELYFAGENSEASNIVKLVATFYQYDTAKIVMNNLNDKLKKINS